MSRKILSLVTLIALVGILSCSDHDPITPDKTGTVAPPPVAKTIYVEGLSGAAANVYYAITGGGSPSTWTLAGTIPAGLTCTSLGSFQANTGDVIYWAVIPASGSFGLGGVNYRGRLGSCPSNTTPTFCGEMSYGSSCFSFTVTSDHTVGIKPLYESGQFMICS